MVHLARSEYGFYHNVNFTSIDWADFVTVPLYTEVPTCGHSIKYNGSQLKNPDISGAIFVWSLSIRMLNSQCVENAIDVRVL